MYRGRILPERLLMAFRKMTFREYELRISRPYAFLLGTISALLAPLAIPRVGIDYPYFFIFGITLSAWFTFKWDAVKSLPRKGNYLEIILGLVIIAADYVQNYVFDSRLGLIDMLVVFSALVVMFYGVKSFKLFWVPATYGLVLLLGYQLESVTPNYVALQDWMAGVMASAVQAMGISATASGHVVAMNSSSGPLLLDVQSDCTGVQGVLAFGMLSSMAVLDIKTKWSRLVPLLAIGFLGAFLINIVRLFGVFLAFEYLGVDVGNSVHVYLGYTLFIVWVMVFWMLAFKYLPAAPMGNRMAAVPPPAKNPLS